MWLDNFSTWNLTFFRFAMKKKMYGPIEKNKDDVGNFETDEKN